MAKNSEEKIIEVHEILASAEEALLRAEAVRLAAFHAVEKAREAVILNAAGVASELLLHAAEIAATAVKAAEIKAMEAWEATAARSIERTMAANKERSGRDRRG
jgi:hypothetical protein